MQEVRERAAVRARRHHPAQADAPTSRASGARGGVDEGEVAVWGADCASSVTRTVGGASRRRRGTRACLLPNHDCVLAVWYAGRNPCSHKYAHVFYTYQTIINISHTVSQSPWRFPLGRPQRILPLTRSSTPVTVAASRCLALRCCLASYFGPSWTAATASSSCELLGACCARFYTASLLCAALSARRASRAAVAACWSAATHQADMLVRVARGVWKAHSPALPSATGALVRQLLTRAGTSAPL